MYAIDRRGFLRTAGLAVTATLVSPYAIASREDFDCIVLGAGIAGITTARRLVEKSSNFGKPLRVVVVEGSSKVGGRLETHERIYNGQKILEEVGAEYVHRNPDDIPLGEEMRRLGIELSVILKRKNGLIFHPGLTDQPLKGFSQTSKDWGRLKALRMFIRIAKVRRGGLSAAEFLKYYGYEGLGYDLGSTILTGHLPGNLEELSVGGFNDDKIATQIREKRDYQIIGGFSSLIEKMAEGLDIRLDQRVEKISYGPERVILYASDGGQFRAKTCVNTCSVGMLKSGEIEFDPELPSGKQDALKCLDCGPVSKMIIQFNEQFWPGKASILMRIDDGRRGGRTYFPHPQGEEGKPAMLTAFFTGDDAREVKRKGPQRTLRDICYDLGVMFPEAGPIRKLITESVSPIGKNWADDNFAHGGYSFQSIHQTEEVFSQGARHKLADGRDTPGMFWAGEATDVGTLTQPGVHGAHTSGLRAAEEVWEYLARKIILDPDVSIRRVEGRYIRSKRRQRRIS